MFHTHSSMEYDCPRNFLTFSFNSTVSLMQNYKIILSASPNLLNLNQEHPSKNCFFWSNSYKIEVTITSLIEIPELPNFGHITSDTIQLDLRDKILLLPS